MKTPLGTTSGASTGTPNPDEKHRIVGLPLLACAALACLASAVSLWLGYMTAYNDARSHLNIARHVTDSLTPGLAQLGSVWLPLPHLLMVPLVMNEVLWHTGIAGAVVGGCAFVYSGVRLFDLLQGWTGSRAAAWCGLVAYAVNFNLLYIQSTALTEPVLLACLVGSLYHFASWLRRQRYSDLAWTSLWTLGATTTRYDGWFYLLTVGCLVGIVSWRLTNRRDVAEANVLTFAVIGGYGVVLWILYNAVIFGDPLYFLHSVYSAQVQQQAVLQMGRLPTRHDLGMSVLTLAVDIVDVCGLPLVIVAALGWIVAMLMPSQQPRGLTVALFLAVASPVLFNVIALYLGQSTITVPQLPPHGWFNDRYGIVAQPLVAVGAGLLADRMRWGRVLAVFGILGSALLLAFQGPPIVLLDGINGASGSGGVEIAGNADYLRSHYHGGRLLADDYLASPLMFASGIELHDFITVGFKPYYQNALRSPDRNVHWVVRINNDDVDRAMNEHPERFTRFKLMHTEPAGERIRIYELQDSRPSDAPIGAPYPVRSRTS